MDQEFFIERAVVVVFCLRFFPTTTATLNLSTLFRMDFSYFQMLLFFSTVSTNNNKHCLLQLFRGWELSLFPAVAADNDNCAFASSNPATYFVKKLGGGGRC